MGGIEVDLQSTGLIGNPFQRRGVLRSCSHEDPIVTAGLGRCLRAGKIQPDSVDKWGLGIGHGEHGSVAPRKSGRRSAVKILFVGLTRLTQVNMNIDQARQA